MQVVDKIISNFINNKSLYIGEKVTMSEHMIQTAMLAEKAKCGDDLICSSLLHDYGHFILENPEDLVKLNVDGQHENCLLYTSPSPRDGLLSRMPSSA